MKNLLKLRKNAGLSQQALADRFHLSQQTIYKYENGHAEPDIETLKQLAAFFNVTVDYLIGQEDTSDEIQLDYTVDEKEIITMFRKLTPNVRLAIASFLNDLTKE